MRTFLRRIGIMAFACLSLGLWADAATKMIEANWVLSSGWKTLMLGASLACLAALLLSELSSRAAGLLASTHREVVVAELETILGQDSESPEEQLLLQRCPGSEARPSATDLMSEQESGLKEWSDVGRIDFAEVL